MHILLVEDDPVLGEGLQKGLATGGHTVDWLTCGQDAEAAMTAPDFDAVVLDLGLPRLDGREVLKRWRNNGVDTPVLVLTAYDRDGHCVRTLDNGADDYVMKPIALDELTARLRALQRRTAGEPDNTLSHGTLALDRKNRTASLNNVALDASQYEYTILETLMERRGSPVSRETLEARLYGWEDGPESNSLEVLIHKLRSKIGRDAITTVRGLGYQFGS